MDQKLVERNAFFRLFEHAVEEKEHFNQLFPRHESASLTNLYLKHVHSLFTPKLQPVFPLKVSNLLQMEVESRRPTA